MKLRIIFFFIWALAISNLFYQEFWGLNTVIAATISVVIVGIFQSEAVKSPKWWFVALCWLISSVGLFVNGSFVAAFIYITSFLFFFAVSNRTQLSLITGGIQSLQSWCTGFYYSMERLIKSIGSTSGTKSKKYLVNTLIISGCLLVAIIFLKLYQAADPTFYEWTKFINLDWISWGFIFFYLFMLIFLYGFYFYEQEVSINDWEDNRKNDIPITYTDRVQKFLGYKNELKGSIALLTILNVFILLYNIIDFRYIFYIMDSGHRGHTDSVMIHDGVNSLIASIILVILLTSFIFRGKLNFLKNRTLRLLAVLWLVQNVAIVSTTCVKNLEYISHYGLTYKRIGVIIYLALAVIGIGFTIYKLLANKSIWYLVRSTSLAFLFTFSVLVTFNWNRVIAWYNLNFITAAEIDFRYLVDLGPDTYPYILEYNSKSEIEDKSIIYDLSGEVPRAIADIKRKQSKHSWRSLILSDYILLKELEKHKFTYNKELYTRWEEY